MEKYNAETMAIVPRSITGFVFDDCRELHLLNLFGHGSEEQQNDRYEVIVYAAPPVEPVVPLSEVLELLEKQERAILEAYSMQNWSKLNDVKQALKQKYGVSE